MALHRWQPIGVASLLAVAGIVVGVAASLAFTTGSLGAAAAMTPRCTTGPLSVLPVLSGSTVTSVTIATVPSTCGGATLRATVSNGVTAGSGSATVAAGGGSVTVPIVGGPALGVGIETDLILEGP